MGLGHWVMDHFWFAAIASVFAMFAAHVAIGRLLRTVKSSTK